MKGSASGTSSTHICGWPRVHIPEDCLGKEIVVGIDVRVLTNYFIDTRSAILITPSFDHIGSR